MNTFLISILAFAISAGQLIRIPYGTGGVTVLDITVFLFCLWGLIKLKLNLKRPPVQILSAIIFITIATISLIFSPLSLTKTEYIISSLYSIRLFLYILFGWLLFSNVFRDLKKNISKVFLLSGIAFSVLGLLQFIFFPNLDFMANLGWDPHYFRTVSTFFDPNFTGAFLVLTLLLASHLRGGNILTPRVFYIFFIILYLSLLTTFSRSSYLMFLVSGTIFSFLKKSKLFFFITIALFLGLMLSFQIYSLAVAKPRNIDRTQSASFRLSTWQQGFTLFQKSPVLGVGFNAYRYGVKRYNLGDDQFLQSHGSSSNDSSLLSVLSTTGIIGFAAFIFFLWSLFNTEGLIVKAAISGLLIHSIFANSLFYPPLLAWLLFISVSSKK
ncbi:O-antigen ligase family protein [Candidatus Daviesbacteria bacterium]|nr:O-antigen ligase family protein [Candidatus Daviesbacteria bacterium]